MSEVILNLKNVVEHLINNMIKYKHNYNVECLNKNTFKEWAVIEVGENS